MEEDNSTADSLMLKNILQSEKLYNNNNNGNNNIRCIFCKAILALQNI